MGDTFQGVLRVDADGKCVVHVENRLILVSDERAYPTLIGSVPIRVGGKYLYDDPVKIQGKLSADKSQIVHVERLVLRSNGDSFYFDM